MTKQPAHRIINGITWIPAFLGSNPHPIWSTSDIPDNVLIQKVEGSVKAYNLWIGYQIYKTWINERVGDYHHSFKEAAEAIEVEIQ